MNSGRDLSQIVMTDQSRFFIPFPVPFYLVECAEIGGLHIGACGCGDLANAQLMERIAIVGAGVAGLTAAWSLARQGLAPVVFEKSLSLLGRAASRRRGDVTFDYGANFFRLDNPVIEKLIRQELPTADLVEIPGDVWTFDVSGRLTPGNPKHNAEAKYTYRNGISQLGSLLVQSSGVEVRQQTCISRFEQHGKRWSLMDGEGNDVGTFDRVVLTAPAPQCLELIQASTMEASLKADLASALADSRYYRQFSFVLGYQQALARSQPFHALLSTDIWCAVAWLSFEEDKPGHLPKGQGALVVQMSPAWTDRRIGGDREQLMESVAREVESLLGSDFRPPDWWDSQCWMMAHPATGVDRDALQAGHAHGFYFAGDALRGRGRVPFAMETGLAAAEAIKQSMELNQG